ncbi:MAG TPA: bifunctional adenosylcobinamide kinase/adenosylcobinamide-phosphate guanylyltransferase [Ilumatobacteraceae bacterium]|nr:bifunctional adenosylcobinamide kinase/adenosylcobinamide-phosphate guanylyltransferase [Ilumatobacteraceae bacterium]
MLTFLLGGARSGKSALAVELATQHAGAVTYVATSPRIAGDTDLDRRIDAHRAERPAAWTTIEEPHDLGAAFELAADSIVIVDCITLWVSNLLWRGDADDAVMAAARAAATTAAARAAPTVVISNEVGLGVHPETDVGRHYRDVLGRVNQVWAAAADRALLLVAGRALALHDPWEVLA